MFKFAIGSTTMQFGYHIITIVHHIVTHMSKSRIPNFLTNHLLKIREVGSSVKRNLWKYTLKSLYILHNFLDHLILILSFYLRFIWREESSKLSSLILLNLLPSLTSKRLLLPPLTWTWAPPGKDYWGVFLCVFLVSKGQLIL